MKKGDRVRLRNHAYGKLSCRTGTIIKAISRNDEIYLVELDDGRKVPPSRDEIERLEGDQ